MKNYLQRVKKWLLEEKYNGRMTSDYFKDLERLKRQLEALAAKQN